MQFPSMNLHPGSIESSKYGDKIKEKRWNRAEKMRQSIRILCIFDEDAEGCGPHDLMKSKGRGRKRLATKVWWL